MDHPRSFPTVAPIVIGRCRWFAAWALILFAAAVAAPAAHAVDPSLRAPTELPLTLPATPYQAVPTHIDADGVMDLVVVADASVGRSGGQLLSLKGAGDGTFTIRHQIEINADTTTVELGDLNGDGLTDAVVSGVGEAIDPATSLPASIVRLFLMRGAVGGGFQPSIFLHSLPVGSNLPPFIELVNLNDDAVPDVVFTDRNAHEVVGLVSNGRGGVTPLKQSIPLGSIMAMTAADLNGDGREDLVFGQFGFVVVVLADRGSPSGFRPPTYYATEPGASLTGLSLVDVNQDGVLDIAVTTGTTKAYMHMGLGGGQFDSIHVPLDFAPGAAIAERQVDLNGDGYPDLVATNGGIPAFRVLPSTDGGPFGRIVSLPTGLNVGPIVPTDINGDEKMDVVVVDGPAAQVTGFVNTTAVFPAPVVTTGPPTAVTKQSATVTGLVTSRQAATSYTFEYGPTTAYGQRTPAIDIPRDRFRTPVQATLGDQFAGATIHYRLVATNRFGTAIGADQAVTTLGLVGAVAFAPKWRVSRQLGSLAIAGLPHVPGTIDLAITSVGATTPVQRARIRMSPTTDRANVRLRPGIPPGEYEVRLTGPDVTGATLTHAVRLLLTPPSTGYARASFSTIDGGPPKTVIRRREASMYINYAFSHDPVNARRGVVQTCTGPPGVTIARTDRRYKADLSIGLSRRTPGRYTCTLFVHVGTTKRLIPVVRATVRVR